MDSGYYAACAGLVARTQALDTIAGNMANTSTAGYRAQKNLFSSVLAQTGKGSLTPLNQAANNYGVLSGTRLDLTQGTMSRTGNDLDVGIEGPAFFAVQTSSGGTAYTRAGNFQVSGKGQLVTAAGDPVLGANGPISLGQGPVSISTDGTISANGAIAGKLKLVEFAPGVDLTSQGASYYAAPPNTGAPATQSELRQGSLEGSNVNPVTGVVELIGAQRSAETMRHILSMLDSEMDKTATQDLPRVS